MKIFTNLPGNLRVLFGVLRILTIIMGCIWLILGLVILPLLGHFKVQHGPYITIGDVVLQADPATIPPPGATGQPAALAVSMLRTSVQVKLPGTDSALRAAVFWTIMPYTAVAVLGTYILLTALRKLCANLESGEVFNDENLHLVRRAGLTLIAMSLLQGILALVASAVLGPLLRSQEVVLAGAKFFQMAGAVRFELPAGVVSVPAGLIAGCLVLALAEAFRQGLHLKTENDLTV